MPTDAATASSPPDQAAAVKAERGSPEPESSSSHSSSPRPPAIKQIEMMTRNYSDFMRSLAAKYNNAGAPRDGFPSNGMVRGLDPSKGGLPFLVRNAELEGNPNRFADSCLTSLDTRNKLVAPSPVTCGLPDFSSSQTLLNLVRTASAQSASQLENYLRGAVKRNADNVLDPLDLTVANTIKKPKLEEEALLRENRDFPQLDDFSGGARTVPAKPSWMSLLDKRMHSSPTSSKGSERCVSLCTDKSCTLQSEASDLSHWSVEDVCKFVSSVETCSEYAEKFREQWIDGSTLPLLTEDHLMTHMGLKLGPALKLRATLAKRIGHCAVCMHCSHCHGDDSHDSSRSPSLSK